MNYKLIELQKVGCHSSSFITIGEIVLVLLSSVSEWSDNFGFSIQSGMSHVWFRWSYGLFSLIFYLFLLLSSVCVIWREVYV